ncbi:hypothetical protein [Cupriavidus sp. IDO]|uniref:hypothetical protein n=1 Tax=Cupriavidus sp. IDO TaxID=1539142 RepID=UPI001EE6E693|nr:hypothetical protein [Cupriavidus sp. IDO]
MRDFGTGRRPRSDFHIGFRSRVLAASAGLGHTCDYIFLRTGETQNEFVTKCHEWWACLRGGIRIAEAGQEPVLMSGGDIFVPAAGVPMQLNIMLDTILVRVMPAPDDAQSAGTPAAPIQAEFAWLSVGEDDWGRRLRARGLRWALCYRGALSLHWRPAAPDARGQCAPLQPGTLYAPDPQDACEIDVLQPGSGLLCCMQGDRAGNLQALCAPAGLNEERREPSRREALSLPG